MTAVQAHAATAELASAAEPVHVVAESEAEVRSIEPDLLKLLQRERVRTPNTDVDRFLATARFQGGDVRPYVALWRNAGGTAAAAIVARVSRRRVVPRVGYFRVPSPRVCCLDVVFGGFLGDRSPASITAMTAHLRELLRTRAVGCVAVNHLDEEHPVAPLLRRSAGAVVEPSVRWSTTLHPDLLTRKSSKHRSALRRSEKRLGEEAGGAVRLVTFSEPADVDAFVRGASELASRTWQGGIGAGFGDTPQWRSLLEIEAKAGRLRAYLLMCGDTAAALQVGAVYGGRYYLEVIGYDPRFAARSPGTILLTRAFEDLIARHVSEFDFGFGDADYKRAYGADQIRDVCVRIYGRGAAALTGRVIDGSALMCESIAERIASKAHSRHAAKRWARRVVASLRRNNGPKGENARD